MRGATASLKSSVVPLLCRPDLIVGTTGTQLENLNTVVVTGSHGDKGQVAALKGQRQGGYGFHNE